MAYNDELTANGFHIEKEDMSLDELETELDGKKKKGNDEDEDEDEFENDDEQ